MGEGGGKDKRRAVSCAVAILHEEKGIIVGGIEVGRYGKLTCSVLVRAFCLNGSLTAVTRQLEEIQGNDEILADTIALTEEETEKIIMKFGWSPWDH